MTRQYQQLEQDGDSTAQAILATVVYYDLWHHALTLWEVWSYLAAEQASRQKPDFITLQEMQQLLATNKLLGDHLVVLDDYVVLRGREALISRREQHAAANARHWIKARRILRWLALIPFVRMIGVSGSLAMERSDEQSDIDFFLVAASGRIWLVRLIAVGLLRLAGVYRTDKRIAERICLNHIISTAQLKSAKENLFLARSFTHLTVGYNFSEYRRFLASNDWITRYLVRYPLSSWPPFQVIEDGWGQRVWKKPWEKVLAGQRGDWWEQKAKQWQRARIERDERRLQPGAQVVISDSELCFHLKAQEPVILEAFARRIAEYVN